MDVDLDISRIKVDESGVPGLIWPLAREEFVAMRDSTLPPLVAASRWSVESVDEDAELLSIVAPALLNEAMSLYQAYALTRRYAEFGHRVGN